MKLSIALLILSASVEFGVDWQLIERIAMMESAGGRYVISETGEYVGVMQIHYGIHRNRAISLGCHDLLDPACNIRVGTSILRDCQKKGYTKDDDTIKCYQRGWQ